MKTYTYKVSFVLTVFLAACSKSATDPLENEIPFYAEAHYTVLLDQNGTLNPTNIKSVESEMVLESTDIDFPTFSTSNITYGEEETFCFFEVTSECTGSILLYNLFTAEYRIIQTFSNLDACSLEITSVSHNETQIFLTFVKSEVGKSDSYYVRIINLNQTESPVDVELALKPLQAIPSNGKLFVLTHDLEITDENGICVVDIDDQTIIHEKLIGFNAKRLIKKPSGQMIISYPELHTVLNASTFEETYTQYGETLRPNIYSLSYPVYDSKDNLYYTMSPEGEENRPIPAGYDFDSNKATLYYFENFLTAEELTTELNIHSATAMGYDLENDYIVVGYRKNGTANTGGILRLKPAPEFAYIDHIELDGIPKAIVAK